MLLSFLTPFGIFSVASGQQTSLNAEAVNLSSCPSFLVSDTWQFLVVNFSSFETTRRQNECILLTVCGSLPVVAVKNREVL